MEQPPPTPEEAFYGKQPPDSNEDKPSEVTNSSEVTPELNNEPAAPPLAAALPQQAAPKKRPTAEVIPITPSTLAPSGMNTFETYLQERQLRLLAGPLGLQYITRAQVAAHLGYVPARPSDAISIPYYDINGGPIIDGADPYVRLRLLSTSPGSAKYLQKKGSLPHAYFTPQVIPGVNPGLDWRQIPNDPTIDIVITEGELKAVRANLTPGYPPTVGLGGVDSYGGRSAGTPLLPELQMWDWHNRTVYICFDADEGTAGYKPSVQGAIDRFASTLIGLGARPQIVHLGAAAAGKLTISAGANAPAAKIGLDDYILAGGTWSVLALTAEEADPKDAMRAMLANYVEVQNKGLVIDVQSGEVMNYRTFLATTAQKYTGHNAKGEAVSLANQFFRSDRHTIITHHGVWPGHPAGLTSIPVAEAKGGLPTSVSWDATKTTLVYNDFAPPPGWFRTSGEQPDATTITIWREFVSRFFAADPSLEQLFHDWVAWPLKNPDQRNHTSWVLQSPEHGIGKSLLGEVPSRMVGQLGLVGGPDTFGARFNYSLMGKKFITINEVMDDKGFYRQFKAYRTNDQLAYEKKHFDVVYNRNYCNFVITTNEAVAYRIDPNERRDIVYTPPWLAADAAWNDYLVNTVVPAITTAEGLRTLLTWYRYDYVLTPGYSGTDFAPRTAAKTRMSEASASNNERAARELMKELTEATPMPVIENRALREGLRGSALDHQPIVEHLKRLAGAAGSAHVVYKAADGTPQRVLILRGDAEAFRRLTRLEKEQVIADSAQALMGWLQGV